MDAQLVAMPSVVVVDDEGEALKGARHYIAIPKLRPHRKSDHLQLSACLVCSLSWFLVLLNGVLPNHSLFNRYAFTEIITCVVALASRFRRKRFAGYYQRTGRRSLHKPKRHNQNQHGARFYHVRVGLDNDSTIFLNLRIMTKLHLTIELDEETIKRFKALAVFRDVTYPKLASIAIQELVKSSESELTKNNSHIPPHTS